MAVNKVEQFIVMPSYKPNNIGPNGDVSRCRRGGWTEAEKG